MLTLKKITRRDHLIATQIQEGLGAGVIAK
jgi:hypothetical protein